MRTDLNQPNHSHDGARALAVLATVGSMVVAMTGCGTGAMGSTSAGAKPTIVVSTTQVADFTRELVGNTATVTPLLTAGQSAHGFDPSAAQLTALSRADALVVNGAGLEVWLDDAITASGFKGKLIDASAGIALITTDDHDHHADHADHVDYVDHGDVSAAPARSPATATPAAATKTTGNPHVWTDPALAKKMVTTITDGLSGLAKVDRATLAANAQRYGASLDALTDWITANIATVPESKRLLVTNHDAFAYFIAAYHITFIGSVIPSFDDHAEPSAAAIDALVAKIRATGTTAIFSESSISPKTAEVIGAEAGVKVYSGPDALYGDSLGVAGSNGDTYLKSEIHNARVILESWGVTPTQLPTALAR